MTPSAPDGRDSLDALAPVRGERPPRCSAQAEEEAWIASVCASFGPGEEFLGIPHVL